MWKGIYKQSLQIVGERYSQCDKDPVLSLRGSVKDFFFLKKAREVKEKL